MEDKVYGIRYESIIAVDLIILSKSILLMKNVLDSDYARMISTFLRN